MGWEILPPEIPAWKMTVTECRRCKELEKRLARIVNAVEKRLEHSHNDTCSKMLSSEYECSCGHESLFEAIAAAGEDNRDK